MALPLPEGKKILINHKKLEGDYRMPSLEASSDHYLISFLVHGDRRIITPTMSYTIHAGDINLIPPYMYHQSAPDSNEFYEGIQIKFATDFAKPLQDRFGMRILDEIYEAHYCQLDPQHQTMARQIFENMLRVQEENTKYSEFQLQCLLCELLIFVLQHGKTPELSQKHSSSLSEPILNAIYYLESNYAKQIKIKDVADVSGYSTAYFSRLFQSQLGYSFSDYLCNIRLRHIKSLLLTTDMSVTEIALETGFQYPGNMTGMFRQKTGMSPNQFRKNNHVN